MPDTTSPSTSVDEREIARMIAARKRSHSSHRHWRCPSAEQVAAYLDQSLAARDKVRFEAHLAECDFCTGLVGSLIRQQERQEHVEAPSHLIRQAINAVPEKASAGRSWRWVLAPTLATIVVASAVLLKLPQPAKVRPPDISAPAVEQTAPPMLVPELESKPAGAPQVRSRKVPSTALQLLEPRPGSNVRGEVRLRWKAVTTAAYYEIRVVNSEGDPIWHAESTEAAARVPANLSLRPGKYFVWVRAHLSNGRTIQSDTVAFHVVSTT